ncbi:MAG: DUF2007 domain-containing protein [Nitrospira sp.]|jgi:hypothetical protein|nr:DUF2007 domain-containing protein [Nitrospira sp.]
MAMRYLTTAQDMGELAIIKSLCEANAISCFFQHEHISSLYPGCSALLCRLLVDEADWERTGILLRRLRMPLREVGPTA